MERSSKRWSRCLILSVFLLAIIPLPSTCAKKKASSAGKKSRGGGGGGGGGGGEEGGISSDKVLEACNQGMSPKAKKRLASKHLDRASRVTGSDAIWHLTQAIECGGDKGKGSSGDMVGEASFRRAVVYETAGSRREAMEDMKRACSSLPPSAALGSDACMTLGVWSSEVGDTLTAYKAFSVAVTRNVQDERAWSNYGVVSNQMGKYEEALRSYKNAAALNPAKGQNFFK